MLGVGCLRTRQAAISPAQSLERQDEESRMKALLTFLVLGGALALLAAVAVGLMISLGQERPSYLLITVFAVDSVAIIFMAACFTLRGGGGRGPRQGSNGRA